VKHLCDIFGEVKRVLKKEGTCFVNIGDTYYAKNASGFMHDRKAGNKSISYGLNKANKLRERGLLPGKCISLEPFRFAIEMVNCGWILRNTII